MKNEGGWVKLAVLVLETRFLHIRELQLMSTNAKCELRILCVQQADFEILYGFCKSLVLLWTKTNQLRAHK